MSKTKVYLWVAWCYLKIIVSFLIALGMLAGIGWGLLTVYLTVAGPTLPIVLGGFAVLLPILLFLALPQIFAKLSERHKVEPGLVERAKRVVGHLVQLRKIPRPRLYFLSSNPNGSRKERMLRWVFGLADLPWGRDSILVGEAGLNHLSEVELTGVLAHELRHSDAFENKLRIVHMVVGTWNSLLLKIGGIWFVLLHLFRSDLRFWDGLGLFGLGYLLVLSLRWYVSLPAQAMSRATEYKTDALSALDLGTPEPLIEALSKLTQSMHGELSPAELSARRSIFGRLTASHPSLADRIAALRRIKSGPSVRVEAQG